MAVIKFSIPDAWVQDNNYVYGVLAEDTTRARTIKAMNESLEEWDYPISITEPDQVREMWVEPEMLLRESWNPDFISHERIKHWVHVLYANAEELG